MSADASMILATQRIERMLAGFQFPRNYFKTVSLSFIVYMFAAACMAAQSIVPSDILTFRKRDISDYLPQGIRYRGLLISPGLEISSTYDDNIFRTPFAAESDLITSFKPALGIQTNWNRHALFFGVEGDFGFYKNHSSENYQDYGVILSGQFDFTDETYLILAVSKAERHLSRGLLLDPDANAPTEYKVNRQQAQFVRELGMLQLELNAKNEDVTLSNVTTTGEPLDSFTERDNQDIGGRLAFEYIPGNALFSEISYATTDYNIASGTQKNARGTDIKAGLEIDTSRGISGSLFATRIARNYETSSSDTTDFYPGASLNWDITALTTVYGYLETHFNDTTVAGVAGVISTLRRGGIRHQVTSRVKANIYGGLNDYEYAGGEGSINRNTELRYGGIGAEYKASEHLGLRLAYDLQDRSSPIASDEYRDNKISLSLVYMY